MISGPLKAAILAFCVVGISTYLAENNDIKMAALVATIPIAIPVTWFLKENGVFEDWSFSFLYGISVYFVVALLFHTLVKNKFDKGHAIIIVMSIWLLLILFGWKYVV